MAERNHNPDFPDQKAITRFLRSLLSAERTQPQWAQDARVPYNTLTNWFADPPPRMRAESFLQLVIAARAVDQLRDWLNTYTDPKESAGVSGTDHEELSVVTAGRDKVLVSVPLADDRQVVEVEETGKKKRRHHRRRS